MLRPFILSPAITVTALMLHFAPFFSAWMLNVIEKSTFVKQISEYRYVWFNVGPTLTQHSSLVRIDEGWLGCDEPPCWPVRIQGRQKVATWDLEQGAERWLEVACHWIKKQKTRGQADGPDSMPLDQESKDEGPLDQKTKDKRPGWWAWRNNMPTLTVNYFGC